MSQIKSTTPEKTEEETPAAPPVDEARSVPEDALRVQEHEVTAPPIEEKRG